jgi:hypothetical protein
MAEEEKAEVEKLKAEYPRDSTEPKGPRRRGQPLGRLPKAALQGRDEWERASQQ